MHVDAEAQGAALQRAQQELHRCQQALREREATIAQLQRAGGFAGGGAARPPREAVPPAARQGASGGGGGAALTSFFYEGNDDAAQDAVSHFDFEVTLKSQKATLTVTKESLKIFQKGQMKESYAIKTLKSWSVGEDRIVFKLIDGGQVEIRK
eukprot:COSAG02_NODE_10546_length_1917_cov_1.254675_2_plen_153_part_00